MPHDARFLDCARPLVLLVSHCATVQTKLYRASNEFDSLLRTN
jgi:hypothetical protein